MTFFVTCFTSDFPAGLHQEGLLHRLAERKQVKVCNHGYRDHAGVQTRAGEGAVVRCPGPGTLSTAAGGAGVREQTAGS